MQFYWLLNVFISLFQLQYNLSESQLVVNIKNGGGEIMQETILADTATDTIRLFFTRFDGSKITQFIDFKNVRNLFNSVQEILVSCVVRGEEQFSNKAVFMNVWEIDNV